VERSFNDVSIEERRKQGFSINDVVRAFVYFLNDVKSQLFLIFIL
jgi:hypothetical protein